VARAATAASLAAWFEARGTEAGGEEEDGDDAVTATPLSLPSPSTPLPLSTLAAALDPAAAAAAVNALLAACPSLPAATTPAAVDAVATAWARITRGGRWCDAGWVARVVAAADRRTARRACTARLLHSSDPAAIAGAAVWALCEPRHDGWLDGLLQRLPSPHAPPDATVAAAAALAATAHPCLLLPAPAADILTWAASGRASRGAADVAVAALRATPPRCVAGGGGTQAAVWRLEARAAAVIGWDEAAGRAPMVVGAGGGGGDAAAVLDDVARGGWGGGGPAAAAAAARAVVPLAVEAAKGAALEGRAGALLCGRLVGGG
jgi:hypothetical protein